MIIYFLVIFFTLAVVYLIKNPQKLFDIIGMIFRTLKYLAIDIFKSVNK